MRRESEICNGTAILEVSGKLNLLTNLNRVPLISISFSHWFYRGSVKGVSRGSVFCRNPLGHYVICAVYKYTFIHSSMSSWRGRGGRRGMGRDFDIFKTIAVKFRTPGQKCEVKYNWIPHPGKWFVVTGTNKNSNIPTLGQQEPKRSIKIPPYNPLPPSPPAWHW